MQFPRTTAWLSRSTSLHHPRSRRSGKHGPPTWFSVCKREYVARFGRLRGRGQALVACRLRSCASPFCCVLPGTSAGAIASQESNVGGAGGFLRGNRAPVGRPPDIAFLRPNKRSCLPGAGKLRRCSRDCPGCPGTPLSPYFQAAGAIAELEGLSARFAWIIQERHSD
jgi:hypothetical protein